MAEDIIPGAQSGQGPAARSVPTIGPDYRSLVNQPAVETGLPDSGGASRAASLESAFSEFEGLGFRAYNEQAAHEGSLAGAAAGATGRPDYKQGLERLTAFGKAFNNAATGAYAVEAEAQADDAAARLRVSANNNPTTFAATFGAVRDGVLKEAPADAVPMLTELYNKKLAQGLGAISLDQATEQRNTQRATYDKGIDRQVSRVASLQGSSDPKDQAEAADQQVKLNLLIEGGKTSGLYSAAEAEAMHVNAMHAVTAQVFSTQVDSVLANNGDIVGFMENFRKMHVANLNDPNSPAILSEAEYQKLYADAATKILEQNRLIAMNTRQGKSEEELRYEAGGKMAFDLLSRGQLTASALNNLVQTNMLKESEARAYRAQLLNVNAPIKSDQAAIRDVERDPHFLDMTDPQIASHPGINPEDQRKLMDERDRRARGWEGTPEVRSAKEDISRALKIPPGTPNYLLTEDQKKARDGGTQELVDTLRALPASQQPAAAHGVAQAVIAKQKAADASAEAVNQRAGKASFISTYGPGGDSEMRNKDQYKARLKQYDDNIAAAEARSKVK